MRRQDRAQDRAFSLELIDRCTHRVIANYTRDHPPHFLPQCF